MNVNIVKKNEIIKITVLGHVNRRLNRVNKYLFLNAGLFEEGFTSRAN